MDTLLLPTKEAARVLAVSRSRLYELMGAGLVEYVKIGRSRFVPYAALVKYVDRLRAAARGEVA